MIVVGITGLLGGGAGAEVGDGSPGAFTAVARADAAGVEYTNTGAPLAANTGGEVVYVTPASAQSLLDSVGRSEAFASAPSPGSFTIDMLPTINGATAGRGTPPLPAYPFIVSSAHPSQPEAHAEQGPSQITAKSEEDRSSSAGRLGLLPTDDQASAATAKAASEVKLDRATGTITATATSRTDGLRVAAQKLELGKSTAAAAITAAPGQPVKKESSFTVVGMTFAGVELSVSDKGVRLGDTAPPATDLSTVLAALKQAGITLELLPATGTERSIESAGLRISQVHDFGNGTYQRVSIILGRVGVSIAGSASPAGDLLPDIPAEVGPGTAEAPAAPSGSEGSTVGGSQPGGAFTAPDSSAGAGLAGSSPGLSLPSAGGTGANFSSPLTSGASSGAASGSGVGAADGTTNDRQAVLAGSALAGTAGLDLSGLYLAIAAVGAAMVVGSRTLALLGVRLGLKEAATP